MAQFMPANDTTLKHPKRPRRGRGILYRYLGGQCESRGGVCRQYLASSAVRFASRRKRCLAATGWSCPSIRMPSMMVCRCRSGSTRMIITDLGFGCHGRYRAHATLNFSAVVRRLRVPVSRR